MAWMGTHIECTLEIWLVGKFLNRSFSWTLSIIIHTSLKSRSPTSLHQSFHVTSQSLRGSSALYQADGAVERQGQCQSQGLCVHGCKMDVRLIKEIYNVLSKWLLILKKKKPNLGGGKESRGIISYGVPKDVSERELLCRVWGGQEEGDRYWEEGKIPWVEERRAKPQHRKIPGPRGRIRNHVTWQHSKLREGGRHGYWGFERWEPLPRLNSWKWLKAGVWKPRMLFIPFSSLKALVSLSVSWGREHWLLRGSGGMHERI